MENEEKEIWELSCKHQRIQMVMHYVDRNSLIEQHHRQCRNKATGVDRETKDGYGQNLEENVADLLKQMKSFSYRPKPVRRTYIPKITGRLRPLGIPSYEDNLVQGVMAKILNSIYEPRFLECSYGFRPNKNCHDVIRNINTTIYKQPIGWVVEADIKGYFDAIGHAWLMKFPEHDIQDKNFLRYMYWTCGLKRWSNPECGGGRIYFGTPMTFLGCFNTRMMLESSMRRCRNDWLSSIWKQPRTRREWFASVE